MGLSLKAGLPPELAAGLALTGLVGGAGLGAVGGNMATRKFIVPVPPEDEADKEPAERPFSATG